MVRHPGEQTSSRTVLEIAHDLLDKGYCLYLDNWYTSPKLVNTLCTRTTDVGTMRTNRKRVPRFREEGQTKKGGISGSIPQETDDHEVERQKRRRTGQHIS